MYGYADKAFARQPQDVVPEYHGEEPSFHHTVDCVILGFHRTELHVLLHRFPYKPYKGHWALLGGFVTPDASLDETALQTVQRLTGLENIYMEQVYTFGEVRRVPTERVITTCYYALIRVEPTLDQLSPHYQATWHPLSQIPNLDLVYDHPLMLRKAIEQLRLRIRLQPIGFELLPEKFTMTELRQLYESILDRPLDKRNFNKKVLAMNLLQKLEEKQKDTSKRGAFYYQFDAERYRQYLEKGFLFEL
ncbi:NUDIX domain-containing protein [Nibrella viscosa]|uniref:NUDIX domain-containing protein n=1 Tax=Nibrella viscosa TaxID=1084524 RepID=A0ABP8KGJ4_9BACT